MTAAIAWFTGLPASGKTTLARRVRAELARKSVESILLDSDELRSVLATADYTPAGRDAFYETVGRLALLLAEQGHVVLVAATAPRRLHRDRVRARATRFVQVWVATPAEICEARDPKGLYAKARAGDAPDLPGGGAPYEPPQAADVTASGGDDEAAVRAVVRSVES
jgi:adenylylsulfate kinase